MNLNTIPNIIPVMHHHQQHATTSRFDRLAPSRNVLVNQGGSGNVPPDNNGDDDDHITIVYPPMDPIELPNEHEQPPDLTLTVESVKTLRYHCLRAIGLQLFKVNCGTLNLAKAAKDRVFWIRRLKIPVRSRKELLEILQQIHHELGKWGQAHGAMFCDREPSKLHSAVAARLPDPQEHLRLYMHCIVWMGARILIDQSATCANIMNECADWPQMRFQLACTYALVDELRSFTPIRVKSFSRKLHDHPLYNFWYEYLKSDRDRTKQRLFVTDRLLPPQVTSLAFQWAISHGHVQLVQFLSHNFTDTQIEYLGLLHWRRISFEARHVHMFEYLCAKLCHMNAYSMARVTWNAFYTSLFESLQRTNNAATTKQYLYKLRFLLVHCCPTLRWNLLAAQDCRALNTVFLYKDRVIWKLFCDYLSVDDLTCVAEYFDAQYHEEPSEDLLTFLNLIRRHL